MRRGQGVNLDLGRGPLGGNYRLSCWVCWYVWNVVCRSVAATSTYFEGLLNVEEGGVAEIVAFVRKNGMSLLDGLNISQITKEMVQVSVKEMKALKSVGLDVCAVECLKGDDIGVI